MHDICYIHKISPPDYKTCMNSYHIATFYSFSTYFCDHTCKCLYDIGTHTLHVHTYVVKSSVTAYLLLVTGTAKPMLRFGLLRNVHTSIMVPNQTAVTQNEIFCVMINRICAPSTKVAGVSSYSSNNFQCQPCIVCEVFSTGREAHIFIQAVKSLVDTCSNCSWLTEYK